MCWFTVIQYKYAENRIFFPQNQAYSIVTLRSAKTICKDPPTDSLQYKNTLSSLADRRTHYSLLIYGDMAKLANAPDSKSGGAILVGSSPTIPTPRSSAYCRPRTKLTRPHTSCRQGAQTGFLENICCASQLVRGPPAENKLKESIIACYMLLLEKWWDAGGTSGRRCNSFHRRVDHKKPFSN